LIDELRPLARLPWVRKILTNKRVELVIVMILCVSPVRRLAAFLARELRPPGEPKGYRLRGSEAIVFIRHRTADVAALGEVFYERQYEPPEQIAALLAASGRPVRILDLGANVGMFGAFAMERFVGAELTAVEPDPANLHLLVRTMRANGWSWNVLDGAATNAEGQIPFATGRFTTSRIEAGSELVRSIDALPLLDRSDFAKIDIEGGEWAILDDPRFARVTASAIVLEHHPYLCPSEDPRGYASARLTSSGYHLAPSIEFERGHGMLWAWR